MDVWADECRGQGSHDENRGAMRHRGFPKASQSRRGVIRTQNSGQGAESSSVARRSQHELHPILDLVPDLCVPRSICVCLLCICVCVFLLVVCLYNNSYRVFIIQLFAHLWTEKQPPPCHLAWRKADPQGRLKACNNAFGCAFLKAFGPAFCAVLRAYLQHEMKAVQVRAPPHDGVRNEVRAPTSATTPNGKHSS